MNCSNSSAVQVHIIKMLSMNHFQVWMCLAAWLISCGSSPPMNRLAYAGVILVPIAVPCICK